MAARVDAVAAMARKLNATALQKDDPEDEEMRKKLNEKEFANWVRRKDNMVRGLELFGRLDSKRGENPEQWMELCEALVAIDIATKRGSSEQQKKKESFAKDGTGNVQLVKKDVLYEAFKKWSMDNTKITNIVLTEEEVQELSRGALSICEKDENTGKYTLPSLQYTSPKSTSEATSRTLTKDQRTQNAIYLKRCRMHWKDAHIRVREKLARYVVDAENRKREKHAAALRKQGVKPEDDLYQAGPRINRFEIEDQGLISLGIQRLYAWLEAEEDLKKQKAESEAAEREEEARREFTGAVKGYDAARIRLPPDVGDKFAFNKAKRVKGAFKPGRFDFSSGKKGVVRPRQKTVPHSAAEMMLDSGQKYVHGRRDLMDKETNLKRLEALGYILRQNYEDIDDYRRALEENARYQAVKDKQQERAEGAEKSYQEWLQNKNIQNVALKALANLDRPKIESYASASDRLQQQEYWLKIGKALKAVDRRLQSQWIEWSQGYAGTHMCKTAWDAFPPKACDIHTTAYSALRATFLKLLKPGLDYVDAFQHELNRKLKRLQAEDEDLTESKELELKQNLSLDRREMGRFLTELGISVNKEELRQLIDAFDVSGDGKVSMQEFLQFTGGVQLDMGGNRFKQLQQRCVWERNCQETGMPNAYSVGALSKELKALPKESIITRPNGERRTRVELPERKRRLEHLKQIGLLEKDDKKPDDGEDKNNDDDDDGNRQDQGDANENLRAQCEACQWGIKEAKTALQVLLGLSRENREAAELKQLLDNGKPPPAPKLLSAPLGHVDVGWDDVILTTELLLMWEPIPDSLVAFFSLEIARGETIRSSGAGKDVNWVELCRDPPDAESEAQYQHWVVDLEPNTKYTFRLRAFNGFGPGPYVLASFTTRPAKCPMPVATKIAPTMITLMWEFSALYQARMQDLKKMFEIVDADGNGFARRSDILRLIQLPANAELLEFLRASTVGAGAGDSQDQPDTPALTIFDFLEARGGDDEVLTWQELLHFFQAKGAVNLSVRGSRAITRSVSLSGSVTRSNSLSRSKTGNSAIITGTRYIVEQCTMQRTHQYKKVWEGTDTRTTLKGLVRGTAHRLRVRAINQDGLEGPPSDSVVINTLLETPNAPVAVSAKVSGPTIDTAGSTVALGTTKPCIFSKSVKLKWDPIDEIFADRLPAKKGHRSGRDQQAAEKIMAEWARAGAEDLGINLELVFRKYDHEENGHIQASELKLLLEDLGIEPSTERLREALEYMDQDHYNIIRYPEFEYWYEHSRIGYKLYRTEGLQWKVFTEEEAENPKNKELRTVCFRGSEACCEVGGLLPNTYYEFRLRASSARAMSSLGPPLLLMTAPQKPSAPFVITTESKAVWLKWYPGSGGAYKYCLQSRLVETLDADIQRKSGTEEKSNRNPYLHLRYPYDEVPESDHTSRLPSEEKSGWKTVYEGSDTAVKVTGLTRNSVYRFRLFALNYYGVPSEVSDLKQINTCYNEDRVSLRPANASENFTVECTRDVVVGDVVLFTERLYVDSSGKLLNNTGSSALGGGGGRTTPRFDVSASHFSVSTGVSRNIEGEFVGERTCAARVLKDSELSSKTTGKKVTKSATQMQTQKATARKRVLRMEVIWSTVSRKETEKFKLDKGIIVERSEQQIFQYECFRVPWEEENHRKSNAEEMTIICS